MRKINKIVVHCADTPAGRDVDAEEIRRWHVEENGWQDIGYHYVIKLDGTIEFGRQLNVIGAHVGGHNTNSIGICYVGGGDGIDTRTEPQKESLELLLKTLKKSFKDAEILGHCDLSSKACPSFDAKEEYKNI